MTIHQCEQGTPEWARLRAGIPTASCFEKIVTPGGKDGIPKASSQCDGYMNHLLAERVLKAPIDGFQSKWMARGNEFESRAIASYELENDCDTERIGFVTIDEGRIGCSPDRFIVGVKDGMVEAKTPSPAVHVSYLLSSIGASKEYKIQLQGELWTCEREWVDIISYCPGFHDAKFRTYRDEAFIKELAAHVRAFRGRLEEQAEEFRAKGWIKPDRPAAEEVEDSAAFLNDADISWAMSREYQQQETRK